MSRHAYIVGACLAAATFCPALAAELTIKDGIIVYDLNGLESLPWDAPQGDIAQDKRWTSWPRPIPKPNDGSLH